VGATFSGQRSNGLGFLENENGEDEMNRALLVTALFALTATATASAQLPTQQSQPAILEWTGSPPAHGDGFCPSTTASGTQGFVTRDVLRRRHVSELDIQEECTIDLNDIQPGPPMDGDVTDENGMDFNTSSIDERPQ
jgi:hypothetical protein